MAHRKQSSGGITARDVGELIDFVRGNIMRSAAEPTRLVVASVSGTIDPFTEEVEYHTEHQYLNASGILGAVTEMDQFFGTRGKIEAGTSKITYLHEAVSGVLGMNILGIEVLTAGVSGFYHIIGKNVDVMANVPVYVDMFLVPDQNG